MHLKSSNPRHHLLPLLALTFCVALAPELAGCRRNREEQPVVRRRDDTRLLEPNTFAAAWTNDISVALYGRPRSIFLRDDLVIVYTDRNVVYVLSATGGRTLWLNSSVVGPLDRLWPPVLLDALNRYGNAVKRILVFPSHTSMLVYADTGERLQETPLEHGERAITSPSYGHAGVVYTGLADNFGGRAAKIDPTRPVNPILLPRLVRGVIVSRPVVYEDTFFVADETGAVYAITDEGLQAWLIQRFQTNAPVTANLTADEHGLYVPSTDSVFYVLDRSSGRLKWRYFAEMQLFKPAYPMENLVLLSVDKRGVVALPKEEGRTINREPVWTVEGAIDVLGQDAHNVYMLHENGRIAAHEKTTGQELFSTNRRDFIAATRNPTDARIYAATAEGEVLAIEPVLTRGRVGRLVATDVSAIP